MSGNDIRPTVKLSSTGVTSSSARNADRGQEREVAVAIKNAREMGLLPHAGQPRVGG
jgi:ribosomal protein S18